MNEKEIINRLDRIESIIEQEPLKAWLSIKETSELLNCSRAHVHKKIIEPRLIPYSKWGNKTYFRKKDVEAFLESNMVR